MNIVAVLSLIAVAIPATGLAYEKAFPETKPGKFEVKTLPERTVIVAERGESYFDENNALFGNLFRYISANDVSMTVPVKADIDPGKMYFYIGSDDLKKDLKDTDRVKVITEPKRQVMSFGVRGGYSEKNYKKALSQLYDHLDASSEWTTAGEAYAIYWNGPYVPAFMKRFEVHVPIKKAPEESDTEE